jgi:hypothetical protein
VNINNANNVTVGGAGAGEGNVISGNSVAPFNSPGVFVGGTATNAQILGNRIGLNAAGTAAIPNPAGIQIQSSGNTIGGPSQGARNYIAGNAFDGVDINGASGNSVLGNAIGLGTDNVTVIANGKNGVAVFNGASGNHIGAPGGGGNVIVGQSVGSGGITIGYGSNNVVQANTIGVLGTTSASSGYGIVINSFGGASTGNQIGGSNGGEGNVIAGNPTANIGIFDAATTGTTVLGNIIGLDAGGTTAVGAAQEFGLNIAGATGTVIGGSFGTGAANVISGTQKAIQVISGATATITGNLIGTAADGHTLVGNQVGVRIQNASGTTVGGPAVAARNVIAGSSATAVSILAGAGDTTSSHTIANNLIGVAADGTTPVPNANGIVIQANPASGATPAGVATGNFITGNTLANSSATGVTVAGFTATANRIGSNGIYNVGGIGIDLSASTFADGATANDAPPDADTGGNNLQNFPHVSSASALDSTISGEIFTAPNTQYTIQLFASPNQNEGRRLVATLTVTTDASGHAFISTPASALTVGEWITGTATDPAGNTSEFSSGVHTVQVTP